MLIKLLVITLLGAPALAVLIFEIILSSSSLFEHANLRLPARVDKALRKLIVTPDMHRIHHSVVPAETNSNYGFNFSLWDRLFGSYRQQPHAGHLGMRIGLERFREPADQRLDQLLWQPLKGDGATPAASPHDPV
jgi:sterol desaturase/sphingolipid hydroxylase (fatty acid hydroxylase superfamily)